MSFSDFGAILVHWRQKQANGLEAKPRQAYWLSFRNYLPNVPTMQPVAIRFRATA